MKREGEESKKEEVKAQQKCALCQGHRSLSHDPTEVKGESASKPAPDIAGKQKEGVRPIINKATSKHSCPYPTI